MQIAKFYGSISDDLEENEWKRLKKAKIWPKDNLVNSQNNNYSEVQYFIAKDLFVPLDLHREFGLPIIKWTEKWDHNTKEGRYIVNLC